MMMLVWLKKVMMNLMKMFDSFQIQVGVRNQQNL